MDECIKREAARNALKAEWNECAAINSLIANGISIVSVEVQG